jgi:diguanylate cyclase (GGDEF)-like protein
MDPINMSELISLTDIYNKFAFEWAFSRDLIQWQSPVHLLLGDISFYESGDHYANRMTVESLDKRLSTIHQAAYQRVPYTVNYDLQIQGNKVANIQEQGRVFFNQEGQMLLCRGYIKSQSVREQNENEYFSNSAIIKQLDSILASGDATDINSAFIYFSIDRFPLIAIGYGLEAAHHLLNQVEELLGRMTRHYDMVGRISGTSFGIILQKCGHNEIIVVAKRLVEVLEHTPFEVAGQKIIISASIGGCVVQRSEEVTAESILQHSERALLDAQHIKKISVAPAIAAKHIAGTNQPDQKKRRTEDAAPASQQNAESSSSS